MLKNHVVIIRMHYPIDSPKFDWRFSYFASMVLPRLLRQKNQDFDIAIRCNPAHADLFRSLSDRIIPFTIRPEAEGKIKEGYERKARRFFVDFIPWADVMGLEKYRIQTTLDSDDLLLRTDYIDKIEETFKGLKTSAHLSFQPYIFQVSTLRVFTCPIKYNRDKGSAFYSIYQPNESDYIFAYDTSHLKMSRKFKQKFFINEGYCAFSVHHANSSSYLYRASKPILP